MEHEEAMKTIHAIYPDGSVRLAEDDEQLALLVARNHETEWQADSAQCTPIQAVCYLV